MPLKRSLLFFFGLLALLSFTACVQEPERYDVFVTVYPMQYLVESIGADMISVSIVPGVSSHSEAVDWSPKDIIAMTEAELLFYVGANFDAYIDKQIGSIFANPTVELVKIETAIDPDGYHYVEFIEGLVHEHDHDEDIAFEETGHLGLDPHFWMSPLRMIQAARLVKDKLIAHFPADAVFMTANYEALLERLQALSESLETEIAKQTKPLLTATNIYTYLKADYHLEALSISPGYHEETEQFTTQEKEAIVTEATLHGIRHVVFEKNTSSPLSEAVFQSLFSLGINPVRLEYHILHLLFQDDLLAGSDYESIMRQNLELIKIAAGIPETE
jgi:zinc transport system substrate-binding protein